MKCNLPKGYRASLSEEAILDKPVRYTIKSMPQIDRRNMPRGYNESPKMAYGTGKNDNFTISARSRRNERERVQKASMNYGRLSESERAFQRVVAKYNDGAQEM